MLRNRAMSQGVAAHIPHVLGGTPVYTHEEMGADVDANGNVINVTPPRRSPVVDDQQVIVSGGDAGEIIVSDDKEKFNEWYKTLPLVLKQVCSLKENGKELPLHRFVMKHIPRYADNGHAAAAVIEKMSFSQSPPTNKTWQDGIARVALYRMVEEYAAHRDGGQEALNATDLVITLVLLKQFPEDGVLMMSPWVRRLVEVYQQLEGVEESWEDHASLADSVTKINDDLFG